MNEIEPWLASLGLGEYAAAFERNDIAWDLLPELDHGALKNIGVESIGHRLRILKAIRLLHEERDPAPSDVVLPDVPRAGRAAAGGEAERRQLTVMFCDLVGSTALSQQLDPEQLRDLIRAYQDACAGSVSRFDGYVAQYLGDGIVVYFGFPRAHEDDAERAVRASLELLDALPRLPAVVSAQLHVRIGVATGMVVVGDIVGVGAAKENMVVGDTPNLAARLQSVARPDTILISDSTRQLAGDQFTYEAVQLDELKGFSAPRSAWRIVAERRGQSRFSARHTSLHSALVGREREVELLLERWHQAAHGEGQLVLLSGEAGIGKSRIVETLRERIADEACRYLRYQCSPYHVGSPFHPVIQQLEFAAELSPDDSAEAKLDKLEALLRQSAASPETVALIASLLSLSADGQSPHSRLAPQDYRPAMLHALQSLFEGLAANHPVLFVVEDLHWVDPSTREMLELIINRLATLPALLIATHRPEYAPQWTVYAHCTVLALNRLSRASCIRLIEETAVGRRVPPELVEQIIDKTDGVPLFVEELTKTILESELVTPTVDGYTLAKPLLPPAIPSTLQDSLMARLDQRPDAKEVAQLAAVIGRQFTHALLAAISQMPVTVLQASLEALVESGLILRRAVANDTVYEFKHALVRDIAYQSLLKSRRVQYHAAIANALETRFSTVAEREPAVLAHHFTEAGLAREAITQWRKAGDQAVARSAGQEAAAHFAKALGLVDTLPDSVDRQRLELATRIDLGPALMMTQGFASQEAMACYRRARELCELTGDRSHLFPATWGLWYANNHRSNDAEAARLADELLAIGRAQSDPGLLLEAYHSAWTSGFRDRDLKSTYEYAAKGIELYQAEKHHRHTYSYGGHDPGVCSRMIAGLAQCLRGYPDQARQLILDAVALGERLGHPFSLAFAVSFSGTVFVFRREPQEVANRARQLREIAEKLGFPFFTSMASSLEGWAIAAQGQVHEGLRLMEDGIQLARRIGVKRLAFQLAITAEAWGWVGDLDRGFDALAEAQAAIRETAEHRWEAEVYRVMGDLHARGPRPNRADAEADYRRALEIAVAQETKLFELRAATGLARVLGASARNEEARSVLSPIVDWYSEGADGDDLRESRSLLDTLS